MRGCVAVLSAILSFSLSAQCTYTLGYSGAYRASYLDVVVDNNDLWAATSYGVQLFDRAADPPAPVATIAVPGITRVVRVINGVVYAASGTRVYAIRKNGKALAIAGSFDAGGTVNDLLATTLFLYVGTANGMAQYDLLNANSPTRTAAVFLTSGSNVTSFALLNSTLYATDGDSSVEIFSISAPNSPQKIGTVDSLPRPTTVKATNGRLYVSDGINTDIFTLNSATPLKATTSSFGTTTFLPLSGDIVFAAGNDRRLRALDWTTLTTPVELFANDISPTGGTINRIGALQLAGGRVYVAAGDAGLLTYDVNAFTAPFPIRNYSTGATTSAAWVDGKLYVSRAAGGISEFTKSASSGSLTAARQWDARVHTLYEGSNGFLLTSSGSTLFYWTLNSSTPVLVTSSVTPAAVVSAVLIGSKAYAILANGTFVSADMGQLNPPPQTIALANRKPSFIAHSGNAVAISSVGDATTTIDWYSSPDFSAEPSTVVIEGTSSSGLALTGGTAAVFNFRGINLISFPSRTTSVIAKSNTAAVQRIAAVNGSIFTLTDEALMVWDIATQKLTRSLTLPVFGNALAVDTIAAVPTSAGVIGVAYATPSSVPTLLATRGGNAYYKKALASGDRLYLYDGRAVDIFETRFGFAPDLITSVRPAGIVDFAITSTALFTLTSGGVTTAYSRDGNAVAQGALSEGIDVQSLAINTAGNAVWVSIARGCFTGACEKKTIVLDPKSLVRTATLDGAAIETATTSDRVFAIFDLPAEIRSYSLADPLHPSVIASIAAEGSKTPVSIAVNESVNVAGDKFYVYNLNLTKTGEWYESYQGDPTNTLQYVDQRARADGGCVLLSGRTFAPQFAPSGSTLSVPAVVKSIAVVPGRYYVLTDYSLEVWTTQQPVPMPRRRASR